MFTLTAEQAISLADITPHSRGRSPEVWAALYTPRSMETVPVSVLRWTDVTVLPSRGGPRPGHVLEVIDARNGTRLERVESSGEDTPDTLTNPT